MTVEYRDIFKSVITTQDMPQMDSLKELTSKDSFYRLVNSPSVNSNGNLVDDQCLYVPLVALGQKTGAIGSFYGHSRDELKNLFSDLGIYCKIKRYEDYEGRVYFGVLYSEDIDILDRVEFGVEDKDFGSFLGVPDRDNSWYDKEDEPNISDVTPIPKYLNLDKSELSGVEYARLVSWICRPTTGGLCRTINIGRDWYKTAENLSEHYDYDKGLDYACQEIERKNHCWYSFKD